MCKNTPPHQTEKTDSLYIVIPAYNEKDNIRQLIEDWYPVVEATGNQNSRLIVVNDGSKDNTYEILQELAASRRLLQPLTKPNGGHGPTLIYGYNYALKNGADWIFQTDSDGQTNPKEFEEFWNLRKEYDAVLGNRQGTRQDGSSRKFVENTLRFILKLTFGVSVPDANAPFRLMKRSLVEKYLKKMPEDFNLPNVMLTTYFTYFHEKITFKVITFKPRQGGVNSINFKKIFKIGWKALGDFRNLKRHIND